MTAEVVLIATTVLYRDRFADTPYTEHPFPSDIETVMAADELAEFAGRSVTESWDRPNRATSTNRDYLRWLIIRENYSALDHASATFWITGISRAVSHELTAHRGIAFSRLSQRHADHSEADFVVPPPFRGEGGHDIVDDVFYDAVDAYAALVDRGLRNGLSLKEAREAASCVLPNCTETTLVATGSMGTWRDVIDTLTNSEADPGAREVAVEILRQLKEIAPNSFHDMTFRSPLRAATYTGHAERVLTPVTGEVA